ncbi:cysA [Symbiodinium sp. KB8]|nr:cysA [Symbiodinium sp. KB8]
MRAIEGQPTHTHTHNRQSEQLPLHEACCLSAKPIGLAGRRGNLVAKARPDHASNHVALCTDADRGHEMSTFSTLRSDELNIEVFGLQSGKYFIKVFLVDGLDRTRSCWYTHTTSFAVQKSDPQNRTDALRRNLRLYEAGYRGRPAAEEPLLLQPRSGRDFAYVTIIWTEDYVDNAIVWATGLIASGSTFRRLCMVVRGKIERRKIRILSRCCCDIYLTDPIQSPALSISRSSRYEFVLTKLRVLQLDQKGIRKIVMMDADTLVLQNVDELFWLPSPSATVNKDTLMGELDKPKLSAGVMVLEPDSVKFDHLLEGLHGVETLSPFVEQDLLDAYFNHSYNIIPLTYNLYPELLDVMPFLHYESDNEGNDMLQNFSLPMDNGIKIVHLWHLFNPFQTFAYKGAQYLQINAKMVHRQMWRWYTLFWTLHQRGLQRGTPEEYPRHLALSKAAGEPLTGNTLVFRPALPSGCGAFGSYGDDGLCKVQTLPAKLQQPRVALDVRLQIAYETWGHLNAKRDNAILLQCGMSASSHAAAHARNPAPGWWEDYIGPGRPLDTNLFFVICTNNLGGCYGSSGPSSFNSVTGERFGSRFPRFEVQDQVAAQFLLLEHLGISKVHACVGSSLGGMQSVCSAAMFPDRVGKFVSISACAKSFPGSMAFRHAQRQAIMSDPHWKGGDYYDGPLPANGLRLARQLGTITYRSGLEWQQRFGQSLAKGVTKREGLKNEFMIESYLAHQGEKWVNAYDPNSLLWISKAMDGFSMEKPDKDGKLSLLEGLKPAMMPALVIGVQHDVLFPVWQQKEIADTLRQAGNKRVVYYELDSVYGHDSFLLDAVAIGPAVKGHLEQEPEGARHLWEDLAASAMGFLQASAQRGNQADSMRDIFRALGQGEKEVERDRLKSMVKLVWSGRVNEAAVDKAFDAMAKEPLMQIEEFMAMRQVLAEAMSDPYLP